MYIPDVNFAMLMAQLEELKALQAKLHLQSDDDRSVEELQEENRKLREENTRLRGHIHMAENAVRDLELKRSALETSAVREKHVFKLFLRCVSCRAANVFRAHNVTDLAGVAELIDKPRVKNFGARTRDEVRGLLSEIGFGAPEGEVEWTL